MFWRSSAMVFFLACSATPEKRDAPATPETEIADGSAGLRLLAQAEGLLTLGLSDKAMSLLAEPSAAAASPTLHTRLRAWLYAERHDQAALTAVQSSAPSASLEIDYLVARESHAETALWDLWRRAPDTFFGLMALRELLLSDAHFTARERDAAALLPAPSPSGARNDEANPEGLREALAARAPAHSRLMSELNYAKGFCFLRIERFTDATHALEASLRDARDRGAKRAISYSLATAQRRRGDFSLAMGRLNSLTPDGDRWAHLSRTALAQIALERRRYAEARRLFEAQLVDDPLAEGRDEALFGLGWVAFRTGDYAAARRFFDSLTTEAPYGKRTPGALYWGARARAEAGDQASAQATLALLSQRFPVDYYTYRAALLRDAHATDAVLLEPPLAASVLEVQALLRADMQRRGKAALERLAADPARLGRADLAALEAASGELHAPELARRFANLRRERYLDTADARALLRGDFPATEIARLSDAARKERIPAEWIIALALHNSGFDSQQKGDRGELGLLQLDRQTLTQLFREAHKKASPRPGELERPDVSLELSARYVGRLLRGFDRRLEYALAAYHAGPGAVTRWREGTGDLPVDIFVEEIPYPETRAFVEDVLAAIATYRAAQADMPTTRLARRETARGLRD